MFTTTYSDFVLNETLKTHNIDLSIKNIETELYSLRYDFSIKKNINNTSQISLHNFNHIQNIILYLAIISCSGPNLLT